MKKQILTILIIVLLFPIITQAKEVCNQNDIQIENISLEEIVGNAEEIATSNNENNKVNLNLKMNVIGDSVTYKVVIKNVSSSDYIFDKNQLTKDYIDYDLSYEDNSEIVKAGEEKVVYLKLNYSSKPQASALSNGFLTNNSNISFNLTQKRESITDIITNPETGQKFFFFIILLFVLIVTTIILIQKNKKGKAIGIIILLITLIPQMVSAICTCTLEVNLNLKIDAKEATFLTGVEVNAKMKLLSGTSSSITEYNVLDNNITSIQYSETEPTDSNKEEKNLVSTADSSYPIYMWFDNGTIYWWSEDKTPSLNKDSSIFFGLMQSLEDISGVENFDTSSVEKFDHMFHSCASLLNLILLRKWNVSNVKSTFAMFEHASSIGSLEGLENWSIMSLSQMSRMFQCMDSLADIEALRNWDTSRVEYIWYLFQGDKALTNIEALRNWNTSSVTSMLSVFTATSITSLEPLSNWDTSNVLTMYGIFADCTELESLSGIEKWDTSEVTNMSWAFGVQSSTLEAGIHSKIKTIEEIRNWNISSVTDISYMFYGSSIESFEPINAWNTSNVTNMKFMFGFCKNIKIIDLSNFNTTQVTDMSGMFYSASELEEIDISSFDTRNVTRFQFMFTGGSKLKHIYVGENWDTSANTGGTNIFPSTCNLPNFNPNNSNYQDISYAHIGDGGYLTLKTN